MLKIGIVGLPNVGKSTLFKALTAQEVEIANYPFATIDPNIGVVSVPDERLEMLAQLSNSQKIIPAVVEFVDIAGLVRGAAEGEGLGNKFLAHIKEADAIAEVVRVFEDKEIVHVAGTADPLADIEVLETELILKDLETVEKGTEKVRHDFKGPNKEIENEILVLEKLSEKFKEGALAQDAATDLPDLNLLTAKPIIYIFNVSDHQLKSHWSPDEKLSLKIKNSPYAVIAATTEAELASLSSVEQKEYLKLLDVKERGLDALIRIGYKILGLITFFTTGEKETRAWTIPAGSFAPRAGRAIHSDFEEKFIKAEVVYWEKLREAGSWQKAKELGWIRTEGKEYVVQDGDVIIFKI